MRLFSMGKFSPRRVFAAVSMMLLGSALAAPAQTSAPATATAPAPAPILHPALFLVGDSLTRTGVGNGDTAKWGWGYELPFLFDPSKIHIYNVAVGGRTSKSFIDEGRWKSVIDALQPGDFVTVEFGANDRNAKSPTGSGDAMSAGRGGQQVHTFGWYIEQYAKEAKAKGATPLILSPVPLNGWTNGKLNRGFEGYAQWTKEGADAQNAIYIDMNGLIADHVDPYGSKEKAMEYFVPDSHTTKFGARLNAEILVDAIKKLNRPEVATLVNAMVTEKKTPLWNGTDLTGWHMYLNDDKVDKSKVWTATDGVLKFDTKASGYLATDKKYSNYHLHVDWRWPKDAVSNTNSGVLVHLNPPDAVWPACFECQLKTGNAGQFVGLGLDIPDAPVLTNRKRAPRYTDVKEADLGQWNSYDIYAWGDTVELFINGMHANRNDKLPVTQGSIALQMEGFPVEFKNIWIQPRD